MTEFNNKNWLTLRLKEIGMSKRQFASAFGILAQHVNRFEELKPKLLPSQLKKLAQILQCSFDGILEFWDNNISAQELWKYSQASQFIELDEKLILKIIRQICAWEIKNQHVISLEDKAILIKLIYQKLAQSSGTAEDKEEASDIIDIYNYIKKTA